MAVELQELLSNFRGVTGDHGQPPLWADDDVRRWFNEAEREAAERARLLQDKTTPAVCTVPLVVNINEYLLHPSIFDVETVGLTQDTGKYCPLSRGHERDIENYTRRYAAQRGWGREYFIYGEPRGNGTANMRLVLDRKPNVDDGYLTLNVFRYPLQDMEDPDDEPEIARRHHDGLVDWVLYRAYTERDIESSAPNRAATHLADFTRRFGERLDANVQRKHRQQLRPVVRPRRGGV